MDEIIVRFDPITLGFLEGLLEGFKETKDYLEAPGMLKKMMDNGIAAIQQTIDQGRSESEKRQG